ncbi:hypothetical protein PIROE2DRAFT_57784 [Piromyces sp. E2]|nr:hypothetical protein PIROE2DRAFT_57784 [Piromyces sp. E2]|eukprot:OUM68931.1 hypothetical protein PIROE2DRAFT_57784 [Piromyces sp. E2]
MKNSNYKKNHRRKYQNNNKTLYNIEETQNHPECKQNDFQEIFEICNDVINSDQSELSMQQTSNNPENVFPTVCEKVLPNNNNNYILGVSHVPYIEYENHTTYWTFDTGARYGTFNRIINNKSIILEKVLYSKNINKNLLSGIKLTKAGFTTSLLLENNDTYLIIKNKKSTLVNSAPTMQIL